MERINDFKAHGNAALKAGNLAEAAAAFFKRVATPQVRNAGTLAGSLALAVNFRRFPSDVGLFLAGYVFAHCAAADGGRLGEIVARCGFPDYLAKDVADDSACRASKP